MVVPIAFVIILLDILEYSLKSLSNDQDLQKELTEKSQDVADWLQVRIGKVSKPDLEESIQLALNTSVVRDEETVCQIMAAIATLHATEDVCRGAIVGGTLLKRFGHDTFPHINKREIRFAKEINPVIFSHILPEIRESFREKIKEFDFKKYADFSDLNSPGSSWIGVSVVVGASPLYLIANYGYKVFAILRNYFKLR
jgi:hypothetical protein